MWNQKGGRVAVVVFGLTLGLAAPEARAGEKAATKVATPLASLASRIHWAGVIDLSDLPAASPATVGQTIPIPSGPLSIDWTPDTVGLLVYADVTAGALAMSRVSGRPERPMSFGASAAFVLPGADAPVAPGTYSFEFSGSATSANVSVLRRRGPDPGTGVLDLNLFVLDGSGLDLNVLAPALGVFQEVFGKAAIAVGAVNVFGVTGAQQFLSLPFNDDVISNPNSPVRQLLKVYSASGPAMAYNVFFVRDIEGAAGVSLGIPSALGFPGTISSGSIVSVSAHQKAAGFDIRDFGQTIAHETAHSMGLYHTTEQDGSEHDTISDTPECPPNGTILPPETCPDGNNFLFWAGVGFDLTPGQGFVLVRSPIVK